MKAPLVKQANDDDDDDLVLERMLAQAERLASEMRSLSQQNSFPATIEMNHDAVTECSSIGAFAASVMMVSPTHQPVEESGSSSSSKIQKQQESSPPTNTVNSSSNADTTTSSAASEKMVRALAAMKEHQPLSSNIRVSPKVVTPENNNKDDDDGTVVTTEKAVVADYTKSFTAQRAMDPVLEEHVEWEKLSLAEAGDDDYVPIKDYSHLTPKKLVLLPLVKSKPLSPLAQHRLALRQARRAQQKRRRRRQCILVVAGMLFALVFWFLWADNNMDYTTWRNTMKKSGRFHQTGSVKARQDEHIRQLQQHQELQRTQEQEQQQPQQEEPHRQGQTLLEEQKRAPQQRLAIKEEQDAKLDGLCRMPLAQLLSPLCHGINCTRDGPEQQYVVTQLVQAMLQ